MSKNISEKLTTHDHRLLYFEELHGKNLPES